MVPAGDSLGRMPVFISTIGMPVPKNSLPLHPDFVFVHQ
jgi:hypothetical protein